MSNISLKVISPMAYSWLTGIVNTDKIMVKEKSPYNGENKTKTIEGYIFINRDRLPDKKVYPDGIFVKSGCNGNYIIQVNCFYDRMLFSYLKEVFHTASSVITREIKEDGKGEFTPLKKIAPVIEESLVQIVGKCPMLRLKPKYKKPHNPDNSFYDVFGERTKGGVMRIGCIDHRIDNNRFSNHFEGIIEKDGEAIRIEMYEGLTKYGLVN